MPVHARHLFIRGIGVVLLGVLCGGVSLGNPHVSLGGEQVGLGGLLRIVLLMLQWVAVVSGGFLLAVGASSWGAAIAVAAAGPRTGAVAGHIDATEPSTSGLGTSSKRSTRLTTWGLVGCIVLASAVAGGTWLVREEPDLPAPELAADQLPTCAVEAPTPSLLEDHPGLLAYCETAERADASRDDLPRAHPVEPNTVWIDGTSSSLTCMTLAIKDHHERTGVADLGITDAAARCGALIEHYLPSGQMLVGNTTFSESHTEPYLNPATGGLAPDGTLTDIVVPD